MVQLGNHAGLAHEPLYLITLTCVFRMENLQGNLTLERQLLGIEDRGHPTAAEFGLNNKVIAEHHPRGQTGWRDVNHRTAGLATGLHGEVGLDDGRSLLTLGALHEHGL